MTLFLGVRYISITFFCGVEPNNEMHTGFWWGDVREGDHLGDPGVDERIILKWIF
jgi:hypothetical protein